MSLTLLRQSLDILEDKDIVANDPNTILCSGKYAVDNKKKHGDKNPSSSGAHRRKSQPVIQKKRTVDGIKKELKGNAKKMELNVRRLLALSQNSVKNADAEKILKHVNKGHTVKQQEVVEEQSSIFTEEDFAKFEKEYFGS